MLVQKECGLSPLCTSKPSFVRWPHLVLKVVGPCISAQERLVYWEPEELHARRDCKLCGLVSDDSHLQGREAHACRIYALRCKCLSAGQPVHACRALQSDAAARHAMQGLCSAMPLPGMHSRQDAPKPGNMQLAAIAAAVHDAKVHVHDGCKRGEHIISKTRCAVPIGGSKGWATGTGKAEGRSVLHGAASA